MNLSLKPPWCCEGDSHRKDIVTPKIEGRAWTWAVCGLVALTPVPATGGGAGPQLLIPSGLNQRGGPSPQLLGNRLLPPAPGTPPGRQRLRLGPLWGEAPSSELFLWERQHHPALGSLLCRLPPRPPHQSLFSDVRLKVEAQGHTATDVSPTMQGSL